MIQGLLGAPHMPKSNFEKSSVKLMTIGHEFKPLERDEQYGHTIKMYSIFENLLYFHICF